MSDKSLYETTLYTALNIPPELEGLDDQEEFDEFVKNAEPTALALVHLEIVETLCNARLALAVHQQEARARYITSALHVLGLDVEGYDAENTYWAQGRVRTKALEMAVKQLENKESKLLFYWEARFAEHSMNVKKENGYDVPGFWKIRELVEDLHEQRSAEKGEEEE